MKKKKRILQLTARGVNTTLTKRSPPRAELATLAPICAEWDVQAEVRAEQPPPVCREQVSTL